MSKLKYLYIIIFGLVLITCTREELDTRVIETKTTLSFMEISNYQPTLSGNLINGYSKQSLTLVGESTFKQTAEDFPTADKRNNNLYFDSTQFTFLKKIERSSFIKKSNFKSLVSKNDLNISSEFPELKGKNLRLVSVSSKLDENLFMTLEVPSDNYLNWSIIKIWTVENTTNQPQIHSVLFAKANNFGALAYREGSILLKENNLVYRIELDKEKRFHKDMNVFVSMFMETI